MLQRITVPPPSGLKCVGSGRSLVIKAGYKDGGHETEEKGVKKGTWSEMNKNWPV
jgi:hypothetical protein